MLIVFVLLPLVISLVVLSLGWLFTVRFLMAFLPAVKTSNMTIVVLVVFIKLVVLLATICTVVNNSIEGVRPALLTKGG